MSGWPPPGGGQGPPDPPPWAPPPGPPPGWGAPPPSSQAPQGYGPDYSTGPQYSYGGPPGWETPSTSGAAVASLVLGLLWICGIGSILAIIFGFVARSSIKSSGGSRSGGGLAIAGIILGFLGILGTIGTVAIVRNAPPEISEAFNQGLVEGILDEAAKAQEDHLDEHGTYSSSEVALFGGDVGAGTGVELTIEHATATTYCMEARRGATTMHRTQVDPVGRVGGCPG